MNETKTLENCQNKFKTPFKDSDYNIETDPQIGLIKVPNYHLPPIPIQTQQNIIINSYDFEP